ncbi:hypothetical protein BH24PSE2_BH24PSE2_19300 [soil metagenome]
MNAIYSPAVLERFERPRYASPLPASDGERITASAGSRRAGALVELSLRVSGDCVVEAGFRAFGCPHTIAAASCVAERVAGQRLEALQDFDLQSIETELDVPSAKLGRLLIIADALAECVDVWRSRRAQPEEYGNGTEIWPSH